MQKQQIERLIEAKNLSLDEVAVMSSRTRVSLGLPAIIPQTDYGPVQRMVDSYLPKWQGLRKMFGLDQEIVVDPIFNLADDNGKSSQFYRNSLTFANQRGPIYTLVEEMDTYDLINSALDLYAEEATQPDPETQRVVWIESQDAALKSDLMDLLMRLGMDDRACSIIRTMAKFGDDFERIITAENVGVVRLAYVHPARLSRIEDLEGRLQGFAAGILTHDDCIWDNIKETQKVSYPWDFVHFRLQSNNRDGLHGDSMLLGCRRAYQQLKMTEDMLVLFRMARGMDRDVYYVNSHGSTPTQTWRTIHEFRQQVRKHLAINPGTSMRQEYNMRTPDEDIFLPVNGKDDPTRVERQSGGQPQGDILDVDHFRRKLFGSLRIPAGFMGFESDTPAKATLSSQDVRFARSIKKLQRAFKQGVRWICEVHRIKKGQDTRDELGRMAIKFSVKMAPINQLEELAKMEIYKARMEVVTSMLTLVGLQQEADPQTGLILPGTGVIKNVDNWVAWVLRRFMDMGDQEIELFLGDATLGLTTSDIEMKAILEKLTPAQIEGLKKRVGRTADAMDILREDDDESFVVLPAEKIQHERSEIKNLSESYQHGYDLDREEVLLRERLQHSGDGPMIQCPRCHQRTLSLRIDNASSTPRSYLLCQCGYHGYLDGADNV